MSDLPDLTDGAFKVIKASDCGGFHIEIQLECHQDSPKVRNFVDKNYPKRRIIIMNVPSGFFKEEIL
tara:strand:- start:271 stop:471 length:201 start_codon:yes stop_codon:yes gene_type:complete